MAKASATSVRERLAGWPAVVWPLALAGVVLMGYQVITWLGLKGHSLPSISAVAVAWAGEMGNPKFWGAVLHTLVAWLAGVGIGALIGVPAGLILGASGFAFRSSRFLVEFLRPIPPVAVLPLAILTLGAGTKMELWLVAFSALWPILLQAMYGVRDIDKVAGDTLRSYRLGSIGRYRWLVLPSALPYIATGLRVASSVGLIVAISEELITGRGGLGFLIDQAQYGGKLGDMYCIIAVAGLLGLASMIIFRTLEGRMLRWHHAYR